MLSCHPTLSLQHGPYSASVAPGAGGRVTSLSFASNGRQYPILVGMAHEAFPTDCWPKAGAFPMLPFANRMPPGGIRMGRRLASPTPWTAGTVHGYAHRLPWSVDRASISHVEMSLAPAECSVGWSWPLSANQRLTLSSLGLLIEIEARNEGMEPMPLVMGWHPYFPTSPIASSDEIYFSASRRFEIDSLGVAVPPRRTAKGHEMKPGETVAYSGWTGALELQIGSGQRVAITCEGAGNLVLHKPLTGDYLCVEPVTDLPGRIGQVAPGARWLVDPGEVRRLSMRCAIVQ